MSFRICLPFPSPLVAPKGVAAPDADDRRAEHTAQPLRPGWSGSVGYVKRKAIVDWQEEKNRLL